MKFRRRVNWMIFITVLPIMGGCDENRETSYRSELNLSENVKSTRTRSYWAIEKFGVIEKGNPQSDWGSDVYAEYNKAGNIIQDISYDPDGSLKSKHSYVYDEQGNRIEQINFRPNGTKVQKIIHRYDEQGNEFEINYYDSTGSRFSTITKGYDGKGNQTEERSYFISNSHKSINYHYGYKFDERGNRKERITYKGDGSVSYKCSLEYDEQGNEIDEICYKPDEIFHFRQSRKYGEQGNEIEEILYEIEETLVHRTWTYRYDYNSDGDWVRKIRFLNDFAKDIEERKIEYFE
jgi:YD repeat-containing protein